jgi:hypothetical protein
LWIRLYTKIVKTQKYFLERYIVMEKVIEKEQHFNWHLFLASPIWFRTALNPSIVSAGVVLADGLREE